MSFAGRATRVIETPCHTAGHVAYDLLQKNMLFAADMLFALGCGQLLECGPADMHASLSKFKRLPPETQVYYWHASTLSNARFALSVDPNNEVLKCRAAKVEKKRAQNKMTLPTTTCEELETNHVLCWDDPGICRTLSMKNAADAEVFAEV
jgi:hydroxyacylglutathione hydrolase